MDNNEEKLTRKEDFTNNYVYRVEYSLDNGKTFIPLCETKDAYQAIEDIDNKIYDTEKCLKHLEKELINQNIKAIELGYYTFERPFYIGTGDLWNTIYQDEKKYVDSGKYEELNNLIIQMSSNIGMALESYNFSEMSNVKDGIFDSEKMYKLIAEIDENNKLDFWLLETLNFYDNED